MARIIALIIAVAASIGVGPQSARPVIARSGGNSVRGPADVYERRMADWRLHQVVYQVFVDRFEIGVPVI